MCLTVKVTVSWQSRLSMSRFFFALVAKLLNILQSHHVCASSSFLTYSSGTQLQRFLFLLLLLDVWLFIHLEIYGEYIYIEIYIRPRESQYWPAFHYSGLIVVFSFSLQQQERGCKSLNLHKYCLTNNNLSNLWNRQAGCIWIICGLWTLTSVMLSKV